MIQGELLVIFNLQSKLWGWVIDIDFNLIFMRRNKKCTSCVIHHWTIMIILYLSCFTLKYNVSLFSPQTSNQWFIRIFCYNFTKQSKNYVIYDSQYWSTPIFEDKNHLNINKQTPKIREISVEARHATVKILSLIYGRLDGRALRVGKPISSSARSQAFYSSIVCTSTL